MRNVIKLGSSLSVTLPDDWADEQGITKGDTLNTVTNASQLILSTRSNQNLTYEVDEPSKPYLRTIINNAYRLGADQLSITGTLNEEAKTDAQHVVSKLLGYEVTTMNDTTVTIANLSEPAPQRSRELFHTHLNNILRLAESITSSEGVDELSKTIQKYDNYCKRVTMKHLGDAAQSFFYTYLTILNHAAWELKLSAPVNDTNRLDDVQTTLKAMRRFFFAQKHEELQRIHTDPAFFKDHPQSRLKHAQHKLYTASSSLVGLHALYQSGAINDVLVLPS